MEGVASDYTERDRESPHDGDASASEQRTTGYPVAPPSVPTPESIARAIRAALERLYLLGSDDQGDFISDMSLGGLAAAEKAALAALHSAPITGE